MPNMYSHPGLEMGVSSAGLSDHNKSLLSSKTLNYLPLPTVGLPVIRAVIMGGPSQSSGLVIEEAIAAGL